MSWTILHAGALGDLVLTIQFALHLTRARPTESLTLVSRVTIPPLATCRPAIRTLSSDGLGLHWLFAESDTPPPPRLRELIAGRLVLCALCPAASPPALRLASLSPAELLCFDPAPQPGSDLHITAQWSHALAHPRSATALADVVGAAPASDPTIELDPAIAARGRQRLADLGCPLPAALIHPGSGGRTKCWSLDGFREVARQLSTRGLHPCFLIGEAERDRWPPAAIARLAQAAPLLGSLTTAELLELSAAAAVYIGNDAGPTHLAALAGVPVLAIFGPTRASVWRPLGRRVIAIQGDPSGDAESWGIHAESIVKHALHIARK